MHSHLGGGFSWKLTLEKWDELPLREKWWWADVHQLDSWLTACEGVDLLLCVRRTFLELKLEEPHQPTVMLTIHPHLLNEHPPTLPSLSAPPALSSSPPFSSSLTESPSALPLPLPSIIVLSWFLSNTLSSTPTVPLSPPPPPPAPPPCPPPTPPILLVMLITVTWNH